MNYTDLYNEVWEIFFDYEENRDMISILDLTDILQDVEQIYSDKGVVKFSNSNIISFVLLLEKLNITLKENRGEFYFLEKEEKIEYFNGKRYSTWYSTFDNFCIKSGYVDKVYENIEKYISEFTLETSKLCPFRLGLVEEK